MPLDPERYTQARALFDELAELSATARADAWRAKSGIDAEVRAQIESWLGADGECDANTVGVAPIEALRADWKAQRWQGRRIGQFELVSPLGEGGMGSVWLGERRDGSFVQRAAIKLLNTRAAASIEMQRRFTTEREILAVLDHPGIARLIDGGDTEDGVPYLVMEHVDGERIDLWCNTHDAGFEQRVRLVLSICEALQAAHAALIVHRDLKPANILVDAQGRTRLLDFGIAKAIDASGLQHTVFETAADQRLMTLRYASPEQVRGERVGTASDLYSLGVVLYELLAGTSPYRDADTASLNLMRAICTQDPEPPSRVARTRNDTQGAVLAQTRRGFDADLDAIVLKALRKVPGERYASIGAFADDLRRLLDGRPVDARQGDAGYRARKFVRRHRVVLALATMAHSRFP